MHSLPRQKTSGQKVKRMLLGKRTQYSRICFFKKRKMVHAIWVWLPGTNVGNVKGYWTKSNPFQANLSWFCLILTLTQPGIVLHTLPDRPLYPPRSCLPKKAQLYNICQDINERIPVSVVYDFTIGDAESACNLYGSSRPAIPGIRIYTLLRLHRRYER